MTSLTTNEKIRYNRHLILPEVGPEGQSRLKEAKVLVIGAGGLGCPVLEYLAAAGVGTIGILDFDKVDESNLQRQVLYSHNDIGRNKAEVAAQKLKAQNPYIHLVPIVEKITARNALNLAKDYDIIVDGSDNFQTRYLTNDLSVLLDKPLVHGSIFKFEGQVSVFNYKNGPTYRCLFPEPPEPNSVPSCSQIGVMGILPGITGTIMAAETIKVICELGDILSGKLLTFDCLSMNFSKLRFSRTSHAEVTELIDYDHFCGLTEQAGEFEISVDELNEEMMSNQQPFLLDVREPHEYEICHLDAINIPLDSLPDNISTLPRNQKIVIYCHHGHRSKKAVELLRSEYGFSDCWSLEGGIDNWAIEIDNSLERY